MSNPTKASVDDRSEKCIQNEGHIYNKNEIDEYQMEDQG